ncbi:hypothetical protein SVIOM74S_05049 [Streptomyces violarus]
MASARSKASMTTPITLIGLSLRTNLRNVSWLTSRFSRNRNSHVSTRLQKPTLVSTFVRSSTASSSADR